MKELKLDIKFTVYESVDELPANVASLMQKAIAVKQTAYAPYSQFRVGCALELDNGQIILGSNQENAAYPSGLCAERVAIFQAGALYPDAKFVRMAIHAGSDHQVTRSPIPPCGSCRQSIAEYESRQHSPVEIYFMGEEGPVYQSASLANLLPLTFEKKHL